MSSVEKMWNSFWSEWDVFFRAINDFSLKHEGSEFFKEAIIARNEVQGMRFTICI